MTEERLQELIKDRKESLEKCNAIPTKLTIDVVNKLEQAFSIDASMEEAVYYANISKQTYYNWKEWFPELFEEFDRLRAKPVLRARQAVVNGLDDKEFALKYLSKKKKDEFADRMENTGAEGGAMFQINQVIAEKCGIKFTDNQLIKENGEEKKI